MTPKQQRSNQWLQICFLICLGIYLTVALYSSQASGPAWDDEIEWIGLQDQLAYAIAFIRMRASADFESAIATNLEFYGIINKVAGYWLHGLADHLGLLNWASREWSDSFTGSVAINRIVLIGMFLALLTCGWRTSVLLKHRRPIITPLLMVALPALAGNSWMNVKDLPFALAYSLFSLELTRQLLTPEQPARPFNYLVCGALAVGCRPTFAPVALLSLGLLHGLKAAQSRQKLAKITQNLGIDGLILIAFSVLLLPASWANPIVYFQKTIHFHAHHPWGGCMLMNGECRSVSDSYTTLSYLRDWLGAQLPLLHIVLAGLALVGMITALLQVSLRKLQSKASSQAGNHANEWLLQHVFILTQWLLLPALAIITNANTYDGLRHWLFSLSALCIVSHGSANWLEQLMLSQGKPWERGLTTMLLSSLAVSSLLTCMDYAALAPYSYAYINELSRGRLDHRLIDLDYWGLSSKRISEEIARRKWLISNIMDDGSAEHIYYPRVFLAHQQFPSSINVPAVATVHKRFLSEAQRLSNMRCDDRFTITRQLPHGRPLNIAAVGLNCRSTGASKSG
jgi:hypothetical protein